MIAKNAFVQGIVDALSERVEIHPFWEGVFTELRKEAIMGTIESISGSVSPEVAAGILGGGALLAGIGGVALKRKLFPGRPKVVPQESAQVAAEQAKKWSTRALLGTGLAGAAGGAYLMHQAKKEPAR
jgi:hypothetical protein